MDWDSSASNTLRMDAFFWCMRTRIPPNSTKGPTAKGGDPQACAELLATLDTEGSDIMLAMAKNIIHISEAEAASNFAGVLARVRAGAEIVIEGHEPIVVLRAEPARGRLISECIALAREHEEETGEVPVLDSDFAADVEEILKNRKAWNPPAWE